jgi:hypothetical protein
LVIRKSINGGDVYTDYVTLIFRKRVVHVYQYSGAWGSKSIMVEIFDLPYRLNWTKPEKQSNIRTDLMGSLQLIHFTGHGRLLARDRGDTDLGEIFSRSWGPLNHTNPLAGIFELGAYRIKIDKRFLTDLLCHNLAHDITVDKRDGPLRRARTIAETFQYLTVILVNNAGRMMIALQSHTDVDEGAYDPNHEFWVDTILGIHRLALHGIIRVDPAFVRHGVEFKDTKEYKILQRWANIGRDWDAAHGSAWHMDPRPDGE